MELSGVNTELGAKFRVKKTKGENFSPRFRERDAFAAGDTMSIARNIAPHLPYLRRFARALEGAQSGGDAFVAATLETLIADPAVFATQLPPRVALYQLFLKLWSSANGHVK